MWIRFPLASRELRDGVSPCRPPVTAGPIKDKLSRCSLAQKDVEHVSGVVSSADAEDGDRVRMVSLGDEHGLPRLVVGEEPLSGRGVRDVDNPSGEGLGSFDDVGLGIVAGTHCVELHHLPGVVLIDLLCIVSSAIEVQEHRWVGGDCAEKLAKRAGRVLPQGEMLSPEQIGNANLLDRGSKVVVPEPQEPLFDETG